MLFPVPNFPTGDGWCESGRANLTLESVVRKAMHCTFCTDEKTLLCPHSSVVLA